MFRERGTFPAGLIAATAVCAALSGAACSSSAPPRPVPSTDPLAAAIAAEMSKYTADDNIRAIIVNVDGRTRFERYYKSSPDQYRSTFGVTASVMSALVGIAIDEGRLHLDDRLDEMLPREAKAMSPRVARVTLRQLLTMTAGFPDTWPVGDGALDSAPNWTRFILAHQDRVPGAEFHYSDPGAHLLSPILAQATGQPVLDYARAKLFDPLGIPSTPAEQPLAVEARLPEYLRARFAWPVDPQGYNTGNAHIKLRPRDMARFGELFRQAGRWQDQQIVPAKWVRQATTAQAGTAFWFQRHITFDPDNYGYMWWVDKADGADDYFAFGFGGQRVEVVPDRHLVVVISADVDLTNPRTPIASDDDTQRLVDIIAPLAR